MSPYLNQTVGENNIQSYSGKHNENEVSFRVSKTNLMDSKNREYPDPKENYGDQIEESPT
jgi:hypothetical protein